MQARVLAPPDPHPELQSLDPIQARVLVPQLPQFPQFRQIQLRVLLLPNVEARLAHPQLPAHIRHWRAALGLAQGIHDLLFRKPRLLHVLVSRWSTQKVSFVQF